MGWLKYGSFRGLFNRILGEGCPRPQTWTQANEQLEPFSLSYSALTHNRPSYDQDGPFSTNSSTLFLHQEAS